VEIKKDLSIQQRFAEKEKHQMSVQDVLRIGLLLGKRARRNSNYKKISPLVELIETQARFSYNGRGETRTHDLTDVNRAL
jgi:hypothetical protein